MNKLRYILFLTILCISAKKGLGQITIVNYDFNSGSSYGTLSAATASNITCSASSTEAWQIYGGIASGSGAYTANTTAGNALAMANSSGTNTRYFQFQLGGSDLASYASYKIYLQAQRSSTGASTIAIAYSINGTSYTNFSTTQTSGNGSYNECQFDLSAISTLSLQSTVYFRVLVSGASGTGTLRIDNFQVRATQQACTSPTKLTFSSLPVSPSQGSTMSAFSVGAACSTNLIATSCSSGSVTLSFSGVGLSGSLSAPVVSGVATFTNITINTIQSSVTFSATYAGSCGSLTSATSNSFSVLPLKNDNFDGSAPTWSYTAGTPTVIGTGGTSGSDVTGLKNYGSPNNNSLTKSYSVDNGTGEKGTLNTITFSNVTGLNTYGQVKFSFQIGSLGSGTGAGTDNGESMFIETSLDGGSTWNSLIKNNGFSDHLFAISSFSPVTLAYNANSVYSTGDPLWNQSAFQVNLPAGTNQFKFRITASNNRTVENWAIDNVLLQGIPLSLIAGPTQTISCTSPSVALTSTASASNATYAWTGPSTGSSPTSSTNIVTVTGIYTVTATLPGSGSTATATVLVVSGIPTLTVSSNKGVLCPNTPVILTGTSTTSGVTYSWSPGTTTPTSYTTSVSSAGVYSLTVTNPVNGCTATGAVMIVPFPTLAYPGSPFSTTLSATSPVLTNTNPATPSGTYTAFPSGLSINAGTGVISPSLSTPGTYTITYTGDKYAFECGTNITAVVVITYGCTFKINSPNELQLCAGQPYNLSATGDGLTFTWAPATGLSCTNCSSPILVAGAAVTYTVYAYKDGIELPCSSQVIHVSIKNDCIENTILGCCFSNYGAAVYVANQNTYVNVYCNLVNELGQFASGSIKKGEFINKGSINVKLDWIHNATNDLYLSNEGITNFFGAAQNMTGNSNTHFNRLDLTGNGIKTAWINEYANSNLNLTTNEFHIQNYNFYMKNALAFATNTVLIGSTPGVGGGFVSSLSNGYLSRVIHAGLVYLFPVGTRAIGSVPYRYRPIELYNSSATDEISVNFMNIPPVVSSTSDFFSSSYANNINDLAPGVSTVNQLYYHKLKQTTAPSPYTSSLAIRSYFPSGDGSFQSLAEWEKDASHPSQWWGTTSGASGSTIPSTNLSYNGLINALTNGSQTFNGQPFTLAQSGPYVGTGGFGDGGTVITVTGGGSTPTTTNSSTGTDGTTSTTVTSTSGGVTTSTITTTPPGGPTTTTTVTVTSTTTGGTTVTSTTTATGTTSTTTSNTTTTTGGVTTGTTTTSTGSGTTSTTTSTTSTTGGVTTTTTSTTPTGGSPTVTTSTTSTTGGTTTSTTSVTPPGGPTSTTSSTTTTTGGTTTSTTTTTDGTTTSTTSNTTTTVGGVTSSTTTTSSSSGPGTTEICETTLAGSSAITSCTLTTSTGTTTYTSSTSTTTSGGGDGSAGSGLDNPIGTGGTTGITSPTTPGVYVITVTPADDCTLPGQIKFTVNTDGTISPSSVQYGLVGSTTSLGPLSEDVYTIDNVNSGIILQSIPKNILTDCINTITVGTSSPGNDYILTAGETIKVVIPATLTGVTFGIFKLFNAANALIATTSSPATLSPFTNTITVPGGTPAGVYHFEFSVNTELVKGQLIIK